MLTDDHINSKTISITITIVTTVVATKKKKTTSNYIFIHIILAVDKIVEIDRKKTKQKKTHNSPKIYVIVVVQNKVAMTC